jgi:hypothetical protein
MHGGHLAIESEVGAGTQVTLWLPPARLVKHEQARGGHISLVLDSESPQKGRGGIG